MEKIVKTYKMEPETAKKLQMVAEAAGLSWDETFRALVGLYEQNVAGKKQPAHEAEIKDFRSHLNALQEGYNHLLLSIDNAEERVREEYAARLSANEAAIEAMKAKAEKAEMARVDAEAACKEKLAQADEMIRTANETAQEDQEQITNLQVALEEVRKSLADKEALNKALSAQVGGLEHQIDEAQAAIKKADAVHEANEQLRAQVAALSADKDKLAQELATAKDEAQKAEARHAAELQAAHERAAVEKRGAVLEAQEAAHMKLEKLTEKYTHQLEKALKAAGRAAKEQKSEKQGESEEHQLEHEIGQTILPDMNE